MSMGEENSSCQVRNISKPIKQQFPQGRVWDQEVSWLAGIEAVTTTMLSHLLCPWG